MTRGITLARKGKDFTVITGCEVSLSEQRRNFRQLRVELAGKFDEIELWSSAQGRVKRYSFKSAQSTPGQESAPVSEQVSGKEEGTEVSSTKPQSKGSKKSKPAAVAAAADLLS